MKMDIVINTEVEELTTSQKGTEVDFESDIVKQLFQLIFANIYYLLSFFCFLTIICD